MQYIIPETDRAAELKTLQDERRVACRRHNAGRRLISKQIAQIDRDIARNLEQLEAILRNSEIAQKSIFCF